MELLLSIFALMFPIAAVVLIIALINPRLLKKYHNTELSRKQIGLIGGVLLLIILIGFGITAPEIEEQNGQELTEQTQRIDEQSELTLGATEEAPTDRIVNQDPNIYWHRVIEVVDGDTIRANVDGVNESVRIIGLDAPETYSSNECFGDESTNRAKELLEGGWVQLERDDSQGNRDKYERLLRYVFMEDGNDFGLQMLNEGYAYEYTYDVAYKYQKNYMGAESAAESNQNGLWSPSTCNGQLQKPEPTSTQPSTTTPPSNNCDPNYTPCIPSVSYDLDCSDIGFSVRVIGSDPHRLDRDRDGIGCESY